MIEFFTTLSLPVLGMGLAITAAIVAMVKEWRITILSLLAQYIFVTTLLAKQIPPEMAALKLLVGVVVCIILAWSARHIDSALGKIEGGRAWFNRNRAVYPMGLPFRFLALVIIVLVIYSLPESLLADLVVPRVIVVSTLWVMILGVVTIMLTRDPLKTGMGLLVLQNGFELLYTPLEPGLLVAAALGVTNIAVAFVASYLALVKHMPMIEAWMAEQAWQDPTSPEALAEAVATLHEPAALAERPTEEVLA